MKTIESPAGQNLAITKEVILAMQESYMQLSTAVAGIGSQFGNLIINGMVLTGGVYSAGLVIYDGKVMIFEGGVAQSKFDIIELPTETIEGIDASGNNYQTIIINKVCRFNAAGQYWFDGFTNLSNAIVRNNYFSKSFTPIAGTGIIVPLGSKVVYSPYSTDIKCYFDVEMSQIATPSQIIKITSWGYDTSGNYSPTSLGKVAGTYRLLLKDASGAVKEQHAGDVILHQSEYNTLILTLPTSIPKQFTTYNYATFQDLKAGSTGFFYPKYSLEISANIFNSGIRRY